MKIVVSRVIGWQRKKLPQCADDQVGEALQTSDGRFGKVSKQKVFIFAQKCRCRLERGYGIF